MYNTTKKGDPSHVISLSPKTICAYQSPLHPFNHREKGDFSSYYKYMYKTISEWQLKKYLSCEPLKLSTKHVFKLIKSGVHYTGEKQQNT